MTDGTRSPSPPFLMEQHTDAFSSAEMAASQEDARASRRRSSNAPRPMQDVVNDAFRDSPARNHIDPEMIKVISAQVTEQVMKNLAAQQQTAAAAAAAVASTGTPYPLPLPQSPRSPLPDSPDFLPARYTPPTPDANRSSQGRPSPSPERPSSATGSHFSQRSTTSTKSPENTARMDTLRPPTAKTDSQNTIRAQGGPSTDSLLYGRAGESNTSPVTGRPGRTDSKISESSNERTSNNNTSRAEAEPVDIGETALERTWQPLFIDGNPTMRLSAFLRGIALHIIDDYEPKGSLVVTPPKMLRFLNETKVGAEHYPWEVIFNRLSMTSLSMVYRKLACPYHLVQKNNKEHPSIPGLTTWGFEYFMTCLIQAHPDTEFERLTTAVINLPISNADDKSERFPKELSRRLLPSAPNMQAQQKLVASLNHEPYVIGDLKGSVAMPPPPASAPPTQPAPSSSFQERQRQPYSQASRQSNAIDDEDLGSQSIPIERQRNPYTGGREGTGRVFGEESRTPLAAQRPEANGTRASRSNSGLPQTIFTTGGSSDPVNIPHRPQHRSSMNQGGAPPPLSAGIGGGYPKLSRGRSSPPPRNNYGRSDPSLASGMDQQYGSTLHPSQSSPTPGSMDDEIARSFRGYAIPPRKTPTTSAYDIPPGSMGGPVGDPIPGSLPGRRSMQPPPPQFPGDRDRRRNTMASQGGGDGGMNGYGSFADGTSGNGSGHQMPPYGSSAQH